MNDYQNEKMRFILTFIIALLFGFLTDYIFLSLILFLGLYSIWMLSKLFDLESWMVSGFDVNKIPQGGGLWGRVVSHVLRLKHKVDNHKNKQQKLILRFNEVLRSLPYATIIIDAQNEIRWISKNAAAMLNLNRKRDIGVRIDNIFRVAKLRKLLAEKETNQLQISLSTKADTVLMMSISRLVRNMRLLSIEDISGYQKLTHTEKYLSDDTFDKLCASLVIISDNLQGCKK